MYSKYVDPKYYEHLFRDEPKVLTMSHLEAGFMIWLGSLSLAFVAFMGEWLIKVMEYFIVKHILKAYFILKQCPM